MKIEATTEEIVKEFTTMIDLLGVDYIHNQLLETYFDYSQMLMKSEGMYSEGASDRLYNLSSLIKVLEGKS